MESTRAGFWWRTGALLLDGVFLAILLLLVLALQVSFERRHLLDGPTRFAFVLLEGFIVPLLYTTTEIAVAGTPGKLICGLRITNLDGTEAPLARLISRWTAKWSYFVIGLLGAVLNQTLLMWLGNLMGFIVFLGCFSAACEAKLAWHDRWAQTAVVRVRRPRELSGFDIASSQMPDPAQTGAERRETG